MSADFLNPGATKAIFITRIMPLGGELFGVQSYKGKDHKGAEDPSRWENHFLGTQAECEKYSANLHHAINPNMLEAFDTSKDVKRIIEP